MQSLRGELSPGSRGAAFRAHRARGRWSQMSMGKRIMPGRPPDKGSFPLDHFSECSDLKEEYLRCLKDGEGRVSADESTEQNGAVYV
eukprot:g25756.t1